MHQIRPPKLRRSWLFVGGADEATLLAAAESGADVLIHELEDFTAPAMRPVAREIGPRVLAAWKARGLVAGVRINPLAGDGREDLSAIMHGAPDLVMLPKVAEPSQIGDLDAAVTVEEQSLGIKPGITELAPNIELARGLIQTYEVCKASARVKCALIASEDLATDLGAERSRNGEELKYVRARFHVECVAAGVISIDAPYTWTDDTGAEAEARHARKLGFTAKSAVNPDHADIINQVFTPSPEDVAKAERIVAAFEVAQAAGDGRVELDGSLVEVPIYRNAQTLLERAKALASY
tara:strand:+ start:1458 stop:2342 length:885 start_codon:yes stop_codon:yes gene_type:complete